LKTISSLLLSEKLAGIKVDVTEVSQSEMGQKQKLRVILDVINRILNLPQLGAWTQQKWSVDSMINFPALLVDLRCPF
jgi:parvin